MLISKFVNKDIYIKELTKDKTINITGESDSGKSFYSNKYLNDNNYIVIDTDMIFSEKTTNNEDILQIRKLFKNRKKMI